METSNSVLFFDKCRLCLLEVGSTNILNEDLAQDIFTFTGVMVKKTDNLPLKICAKCLDIIEKAKDLREVAFNNNKLLCSLFGVTEQDDAKLDSKDEEDTKTLTKHETCKSGKTSHKCHKIKRSSSTSSNQSVEAKRKKHDMQKHLLTIEKSPKNEGKSHSHPKIKESLSTSSNQSVNKHEKKKKIVIRKDLFETPKAVNSQEAEEKKDVKPPRHKMIKKSDGKEDYICGICNKHFITWKKLYLHNRFHNKKIICPLDACGKKFATKGDLEKHLRTHTGVKPYICDICDKGFSQQGTLKVHKETVHYCFTFS